jgi:hypothetical protein
MRQENHDSRPAKEKVSETQILSGHDGTCLCPSYLGGGDRRLQFKASLSKVGVRP